jgi:glutathione peroxidase
MKPLSLPRSTGSLLLPLAIMAFAPHVRAQAQPSPAGASAACTGLLNQQFNRLQDDAPQNLCQYSGQVVLVVNSASYCGYTHQYDGLEKLYAKYHGRGLVVLGFPSNDFEQEPGNSKQIADFCYNTYGVKFPMFAKSHVKGPQANTLYKQLARESGHAPAWNFHKYLIGRDGRLLADYPSKVTPEDKSLVSAIEKALNQPAARP